MRKAIALIELIFAIVVIGITLLAVPNLMQQTSKTSTQVVTQESVSSAASQIDMIMSLFWDEAATDPRYNNPVLAVNNGNVFLNEAQDRLGNLLGRRVGSPLTTPRRYAVDNAGNKLRATPPNLLRKEESPLVQADDVDDYNNVDSVLNSFESTLARDGDFKDVQINMHTDVFYISDSPSNVLGYNQGVIQFNNPFTQVNFSTNIKAIVVTLTSPNNRDMGAVVLRAFSCNIGSSKLKERTF